MAAHQAERRDLVCAGTTLPADGRRGRPVGQPGRPASAKKLRRRHPVRAETPPLVGAGRPREDGTVRPPLVAPWPEPPEEVSAPTPAAVRPEAPDPIRPPSPAPPAAQVSSRRKGSIVNRPRNRPANRPRNRPRWPRILTPGTLVATLAAALAAGLLPAGDTPAAAQPL